MKKMALWLMLAALLLLCATASAATTYIDSGFSFFITPGETLLPDYPDLSHMIGEGLTKDDFIITYSTTEGLDQSYYYFDDNGVMTMPESVTVPRDFKCYITYTPKVQGVGKKTAFYAWVKVRKPLSINLLSSDITMSMEEAVTFRFKRSLHSPDVFTLACDSSIVEARLEQESWDDHYYTVHLTPKGVGETDIQVVGYNGLSESLHVKVANPPSKFEFLKDDFVCYIGDTIPLEIDMGGGDMNAAPRISMTNYGSYCASTDFFKNWRELYVAKAGKYTVTMTTYNGYSDTFSFSAYSPENCTIMTITKDPITVGDDYVYIYCYDENGKSITPRLEVTRGSDIARVVDKKLVTTGAGIVTVTAINPDGSTVDCTVEVHEKPTSIALNASELMLEIGESFDFEVTFDKGKAEYRFDYFFWENEPPYGLYPLAVKGQTVIAQAPGTATISVSSGGMYAECFVTVLDGDKALSIDHPTGDFGIGHTYQLRVVDKTGKEYPAVFRNNSAAYNEAAVVTPSGLMTGQREGTSYIYANLEDGRTLKFSQEVKQIPAWIAHENVTFHINDSSATLGEPESDVGNVSLYWINVKIADESIATYKGGLKLLKEGTTEVTMTAVKGGAQCTFLLTVTAPDDTLYIMVDGKLYKNLKYDWYVPYGYTEKLPDVTDYYGNKIPVTWKIYSETVSSNNPNKTAFRLYSDSIKATWLSGSCKLAATTKDGRTIRMYGWAYTLPLKIMFRQDSYTLKVGEEDVTMVCIDTADTMYDRVDDLTWKIGDSSIVAIKEGPIATDRMTIVGLKPGTTKLTATMPNGAKAVCTITVVDPDYLPGDADGNHVVDFNDALLIFQQEAGWSVSIKTSYADVNGDGAVDMEDALLILRYVAGEDVTLK